MVALGGEEGHVQFLGAAWPLGRLLVGRDALLAGTGMLALLLIAAVAVLFVEGLALYGVVALGLAVAAGGTRYALR